MVGLANYELDVGGSGRELICGTPGICLEGLGKTTKPSGGTVGVPAGIQIGHLSNTSRIVTA
jgi:hypothetical protein